MNIFQIFFYFPWNFWSYLELLVIACVYTWCSILLGVTCVICGCLSCALACVYTTWCYLCYLWLRVLCSCMFVTTFHEVACVFLVHGFTYFCLCQLHLQQLLSFQATLSSITKDLQSFMMPHFKRFRLFLALWASCLCHVPLCVHIFLLPSFAEPCPKSAELACALIQQLEWQTFKMPNFEAVFQLEGTRDLAKLVLNHSDAPKSWKSAPSPSYLSGHMGKLCLRLFKPCPNGVLSSKRRKDSLEKLQREKGRLNQTKKTDSDFFDQVDQCIRISASQFRDHKLSSSKYATFMRKASKAEKTSVDAVLQMLSVTKDEDSNQTAGKNEGMNGKSQSLESLPSVNGSPKALEEKKGLGSRVFKRVLEKNLSEASTPEKRLRHKQSVPAQNAKSLGASPALQSPFLQTPLRLLGTWCLHSCQWVA